MNSWYVGLQRNEEGTSFTVESLRLQLELLISKATSNLTATLEDTLFSPYSELAGEFSQLIRVLSSTEDTAQRMITTTSGVNPNNVEDRVDVMISNDSLGS